MVEFDLCLNGTTQMIKYNHNLDFRIKLVNDTVVRKTAKIHREAFKVTQAVCNHFIRNPDPMVVPVYAFETLEEPKTVIGTYTYSYDMMRLGMLNSEEKIIIGQLVSEYHNRDRSYPDERENYPRLVTFMNKVIKQGRFGDLHSGNIMKDLDEEYRLIDLESFWTGGNLGDYQYNWISK
jgi:hypothetical protein